MAYYDTLEPLGALFNVLTQSELQRGTAIVGNNYVLCTARFTETGWQGNTTTVAVTSGAAPTGTGPVYVPSTKNIALVGTPTVNGLYSFTITVTNNGNSVSISFANVKVTATPQQSIAGQQTSVAVAGYGVYLPTLKYFGASPTVTWTGANLPAGLSVLNISKLGNGCTGAIAGTPTAAGVYTFQVTATGSLGDVTTVNAMMLVTTFQNPAMVLPPMFLNNPYSFTYDQDAADTTRLWGSGAAPIPPYTWSLNFPLAPGMSMSSAGALSGTPVTAGLNTNSGAYANLEVQFLGTPSGTGAGPSLVYVMPGNPPSKPGVFGSFVGFGTAGHFAGGTK